MILTPDNKEKYLDWLEEIRCPKCGFSIEAIICTHSGKVIPHEKKYCPECGNNLQDV